jgi:mono/diheme cytochrome c family protein
MRFPLIFLMLMALLGPRLAAAQQTATTSSLDVSQLFASTCGWCHSDGGRVPGKGPQLMDTARTDDFIRFRIQHGKEGAMPAFGASFSDADLNAIIKYIRTLKPDQG